MADIQALFEEVGKLTPAEAKDLGEQLKAKLPKSTPKSEETPPADDPTPEGE